MAVLTEEQFETEVNSLITSLNNINQTIAHYAALKDAQGKGRIAKHKILISDSILRATAINSSGYSVHAVNPETVSGDSQNRTHLNYLIDLMYNS